MIFAGYGCAPVSAAVKHALEHGEALVLVHNRRVEQVQTWAHTYSQRWGTRVSTRKQGDGTVQVRRKA